MLHMYELEIIKQYLKCSFKIAKLVTSPDKWRSKDEK